MAKRLTDREKKKILADYMELENYSNPQRKAFYGTEADQEGKTILKNKG